MNTTSDIERTIGEHAEMRALLQAVASLQLPDAWISAGFVRNAVWDRLHERPIDCHTLRDVDVVYFEPQQRSLEQAHEAALRALVPWAPWEVRNQARMHERNGDPPYRDTVHAVSQYPETATAVAARWRDGKVELAAPLGLDDLLAIVVRPTQNFRGKPEQYRARRAKKDWAARWPRLRFAD